MTASHACKKLESDTVFPSRIAVLFNSIKSVRNLPGTKSVTRTDANNTRFIFLKFKLFDQRAGQNSRNQLTSGRQRGKFCETKCKFFLRNTTEIWYLSPKVSILDGLSTSRENLVTENVTQKKNQGVTQLLGRKQNLSSPAGIKSTRLLESLY